jgi:hypothetical protein
MSEERKKVLEMLAEGKINTEEAERLLEKLSGSGERGQERGHGRRRRHRSWGWNKGGIGAHAVVIGGDEEPDVEGEVDSALPKYLRVLVESNDGETVNIRVPIALVKTGMRLGTMLPKDAKEKIEEKGIDLEGFNEMNADELIRALSELSIDVESDGETVRIFCE